MYFIICARMMLLQAVVIIISSINPLELAWWQTWLPSFIIAIAQIARDTFNIIIYILDRTNPYGKNKGGLCFDPVFSEELPYFWAASQVTLLILKILNMFAYSWGWVFLPTFLGMFLCVLSIVVPTICSYYKEPSCHICGCTQSNACPEGCYWVHEDLCSSCATPQQIREYHRHLKVQLTKIEL